MISPARISIPLVLLALSASPAPAQLSQPAQPSQVVPVALLPTPWMNPALAPDARADLIEHEMTLDEKLQLVEGFYGSNINFVWSKPAPQKYRPFLIGTAGYVPGIPRLGIPALIESDAGVGIANNSQMRPGDTATAFPSGLSNAATWNPDVSFAVGAALGSEARARGFNVVLDGALNLARDPRGGRTFEYAGEDPLLAGAMAGEEAHGIQSNHIVTTEKHYALNDQESGRFTLNAIVDEPSQRESDLLAFEIAIEHGDPGAIMCAYEKVNGIYACENSFLLNDVLKRDWHYPGWVLSDWGAVHSTVDAANNGLDQESASGFDRTEYFGAPLLKALQDNTVPPARLDDMVHRILRSMFAKGLFDDPAVKQTGAMPSNIPVAQRASEEGIVLLKNEGGILPLGGSVRRIALIGKHTDIGMLSGGGSSQVLPIGYNPADDYMKGGSVIVLGNGTKVMPTDHLVFDPPSPLATIQARLEHGTVTFDDGEDLDHATANARGADVVIVFAKQWMTEGQDVPNLSLPGKQDALIEAVAAANPHTIVVLETGGPVLMPWLKNVSGIVEAWYAGNGGSAALTRVLFGDVNPSGRLPITFPQDESQLPRPALPGFALPFSSFDVDYSEGPNVGYRWFDSRALTPLFPFGFGLSYTNFSVKGLKLEGGDTITANVDVTNTGAREGADTVQVYATPPSPTGQHAVARLVGWSKVDLKPGETRHLAIVGDPRLLASFNKDEDDWDVAAGDYVVTVGESSAQPVETAQVTLKARKIKP
jgi:beta-glucosidase